MNNWLEVNVIEAGSICKQLIPKLGAEGSPLGMHVLVELHECDPSTMSVIDNVKSAFEQAAKAASCTIVTSAFHAFEPHGVSGVLVISESHFTYHGWDEKAYAAIDLFYCGEHVEIEKAIEHLISYFCAGRMQIQILPRGFECPYL